jgi:hypothetical protein
MTTTSPILLNHTYSNVTNQTILVDTSAVDEIAFSISCDSVTTGMWALSRVDANTITYLFQEGPLVPDDWPMNIGPSSSYDVTNALGSTLQIDLTGANGSVAVTVCVTGKAYT